MESRFTQQSAAEGDQPPGEPAPPAPAGLSDVVTNVGTRVQEILDSAERVAADIRAEAEAAAARHLDERRREADRAVEDRVRSFDTLTQSLALRVESLQREAAALVDALEQARRDLGGLAKVAEGPPEPPAAAPPPEPQPLRPQPVATPVPDPGQQGDRIPEQAILRATQMAVAGTAPAEIEAMLRTEFGIDDPSKVVDQMLRSERA